MKPFYTGFILHVITPTIDFIGWYLKEEAFTLSCHACGLRGWHSRQAGEGKLCVSGQNVILLTISYL